jgi:hypothetical protein
MRIVLEASTARYHLYAWNEHSLPNRTLILVCAEGYTLAAESAMSSPTVLKSLSLAFGLLIIGARSPLSPWRPRRCGLRRDRCGIFGHSWVTSFNSDAQIDDERFFRCLGLVTKSDSWGPYPWRTALSRRFGLWRSSVEDALSLPSLQPQPSQAGVLAGPALLLRPSTEYLPAFSLSTNIQLIS